MSERTDEQAAPHCPTCTCGCTCGYGGTHEPENPRCDLYRPAEPRVHNHPPYRPTCNERTVDGHLRGACLDDDGSDR